MFARVLACALCAMFVAPAFAAPIVLEGSHAYLELREPLEYLLPEGASIERLYMDSEPKLIVDGGYVRRIEMYSNSVEFLSGTNKVGLFRRDPLVELIFHVRDYRVVGDLLDKEGARVYAWLQSGDFLELSVSSSWDIRWDIVPPVFHTYDLPIDPTGDGYFGLDDLNEVRNQFGLPGSADIDHSGLVDLGDLNLVRNKFGLGFPPELRSVPEPASLVLMAICSTFLQWRRSTNGRCRQPA